MQTHIQPFRTRSQRLFTFSSHVSSAAETAVPPPQLVKQAWHFFVMDTAVTCNLRVTEPLSIILTSWEICSWTPYELCAHLRWTKTLFKLQGLCLSPSLPPPSSKIPSLTAGLTADYYQPLRAVSLSKVFSGQDDMCRRGTQSQTKARSAASYPGIELGRNLKCLFLPLCNEFVCWQPFVGIPVLLESAGFASFLNPMQNMYQT